MYPSEQDSYGNLAKIHSLLELTCGARSPEGKSHQNYDVPHQNLMTCANVTRFELFFDRDRSRTWNQNVPLGPFFGPPFERNCTSIFSFELRNWIKNGPEDGRTNGRTHMIFWDLPYTISPSGKNKMEWNCHKFNCPKGLLCRGAPRKSCVSVCVRTIFDPVPELETEDTSAISLKRVTKKGSKWDILVPSPRSISAKEYFKSCDVSHVIRFS